VPTVSPTPTFFGHSVLIDYDPALRDRHALHTTICEIVRRAENGNARVDQLVTAVIQAVAQWGYAARVVGRTPEAIEVVVTRQ
jgi:hypothetical protein